MSVPLPPQPDNGRDKRPTSLRLSSTARAILAQLSEDQGISQAGVIELLLRRAARQNAAHGFPME